MGFLGRQEAEACLLEHPDWTFLIRFRESRVGETQSATACATPILSFVFHSQSGTSIHDLSQSQTAIHNYINTQSQALIHNPSQSQMLIHNLSQSQMLIHNYKAKFRLN